MSSNQQVDTSQHKAVDQLYNLRRWGADYITITADGELAIRPNPDHSQQVVLSSLQDQLKAAGLRLPLLMRFPGILQHRVQYLMDAFTKACHQYQFEGGYTPVYPIKVNQQQPVVEHILQGQRQAGMTRVGLEAGSKPELLAVLAQVEGQQALIVCNGYKDSHFIRLALMAEKLGHHVFLVIEKLSELPIILRLAKELGVTPRLGVRARLATVGKGNWQNTGGEKSKFGLSAVQILQLLQQLQQQDQLATLQLLHFHLGSQLANIHDIHSALRECQQLYAQLIDLGAQLTHVDIGGGLGVDYEGTGGRSYCSMNYSVDEYARNVVAAFAEICAEKQLPQPHLISESGRAMTAHHAILLTDIIDREQASNGAISSADEMTIRAQMASERSNKIAGQTVLEQALQRLQDAPSSSALIEIYHDMQHALTDARSAFINGQHSLVQRSEVESLAGQLAAELLPQLNPANRSHQPLIDELEEQLADKIFVNFSLFKSLPDVWGINQIFPIMPISGLQQASRQRALVRDITCDSDGRIDQYVDHQGISATLALPSTAPGELLAFCLVGAYQEILGDMHNLFGDTDSVNVTVDAEGQTVLSGIQRGDTVRSVLDEVNYCGEDLLRRLVRQVSTSQLSAEDQALFTAELSESLNAYTYLLKD